MHLILADENKEYIDLFLNYVRTSEEQHKFILKSFSSKENVLKFLEQHKGPFTLLITPELLPEGVDSKNVILLVEGNQSFEGFISVNKFQPLNLLLSKVWAIHVEQNPSSRSKQSSQERTKIISFFSASGGTGKTTAAINFGQVASSQEYQVFYLNLELFSSVESIFPSTEAREGLETILYYVKSRSKQLVGKIEEVKQTHPYTKIHYFSPANVLEMVDITKEDVEYLLQQLVETGAYDYIVLDLPSTLDSWVTQSLLMSQEVVWLLVDDLYQLDKSKQAVGYLERILEGKPSFTEQIRFVGNKHTGVIHNQALYEEFNIDVHLPYIPEWKNLHQSEQLWYSQPFNQEMLRLLQKIQAN